MFFDKGFGGFKFELVRTLSAMGLSSLTKKAAMTQSANLKKQLEMGCRAFDIRVSYAGEFYASHTFRCGKLVNALNTLQNHDVVVFVRPDWHNRDTVRPHEEKLLQILNKYDMKIYYEPLGKCKLGRVLPMSDMKIVWFNAKTIQEFKKKFDDFLFVAAANRPVDLSNHIISFALTPNSSFTGALSTNLKESAAETNKFATERIEILRECTGGAMPYILLDYITPDLVKQLME